MIQERYEKAKKVLLDLSKLNIPVIVEGKKDYERLRELGLEGPILKIQGKRAYEIAEEVKEKEAIILTDFDARGRRYVSELVKNLQAKGVKVNTEIRKRLFGSSFVNVAEGLK